MTSCCILDRTLYFLRRVWSRISRRKKPKTSIVILVAGLDNSGKSAIVNYLFNKSLITKENVVPTIGFRTVIFNYKSCSIRLYDVGGGPQIRALWPKYYDDVHGVIYVVDSNDTERLLESAEIFRELVCHELISQKPVLFLGNKQDLNGCSDELELIQHMNIEHIVNFVKCYTRVEICSCYPDKRRRKYNLNDNINVGFRWLIETICKHYDEIREVMYEQSTRRKKRRRSFSLKSWTASKIDNPYSYSDTDSETYMKPIIPKDLTPKKRKRKKSSKSIFSIRNNKTAPMSIDDSSHKTPTAETMRELIGGIGSGDVTRSNVVEANAESENRRPWRYWKKRPNTAPAEMKPFATKSTLDGEKPTSKTTNQEIA
ncbi:ADP-ribosylation factor-like protein 13B [Copidosoma floridanum]|uniref:ADP-ribosylation factor-like protein 13B n=1 Tax=Copidosoma floridanum TaxID=29053 RepID=UPI0006C95550|nr:ADP-ribosylation factor-like protein 13B [Copidosoma floridanum]